MRGPRFWITRQGIPVEEHALRNAVKTGIETSQALSEWEAAHAARLDLYKWEMGEYPPSFKAKVLAWYSRHGELELHRSDAVAQAAERKKR